MCVLISYFLFLGNFSWSTLIKCFFPVINGLELPCFIYLFIENDALFIEGRQELMLHGAVTAGASVFGTDVFWYGLF